MNAFESAWILLKDDALRIMPDSREEREFKAFRAIPTSALQSVLQEGILPRPPSENDLHRVASALNSHEREKYLRAAFRGERVERPKTDLDNVPPVVWSFGRNKHGKRHMEDLRDEFGYDSTQVSPMYAALSFGANYRQPYSIIGSKIVPPGKRYTDWEFDRRQRDWVTRPQFSLKGIKPEYLTEVIPVDYAGREFKFGRLSDLDDIDIAGFFE